MGSAMATIEEVITTDESWGPAFNADSSSVSLPRTAGLMVCSNDVKEKFTGDAVWNIPWTPVIDVRKSGLMMQSYRNIPDAASSNAPLIVMSGTSKILTLSEYGA